MSGGLTVIGTTFTSSIIVCVEELDVSAVPPGMAVNDGGNLYVLEADLPDTGDGDRIPSIEGAPRLRGGRLGVILPIDSSEGDGGRGKGG